jgi:hypothetical protein|tara:strand:- start:626 stop:832 length:207 start_codon:yes stop_codon:yes gene_type:complete
MDELMDLLVKDESPSQISDKIKDILYSKSAERIDGVRPNISSAVFDDQQAEEELDSEDEVEQIEQEED